MTDPYTPSPEAKAAYPDAEKGYIWTEGTQKIIEKERIAFDRGAAATRAQQYAATKEVLDGFIDAAIGDWEAEMHKEGMGSFPGPLAEYLTYALLASGGPLVDVREVQGEVINWIDNNFYDDREQTIPQEARAHFNIEARA